jgi:hypothetical protein
MGVIYKLKSEIKDFILEEKKKNPILGCRGLSGLVESKFAIKLSKSSINALIKEAGLSMPVGRRPKKRRIKKEIIPAAPILPEIAPAPAIPEPPPAIISEPPPAAIPEPPAPAPIVPEVPAPAAEIISVEKPQEEPLATECTGAILLKAMDYILGASQGISAVIQGRLNRPQEDLATKTEALIYLSLWENPPKDLSSLWPMLGKKFSPEALSSYLLELKEVTAINSDIAQVLSASFKEVRLLKMELSRGSSLYLDGQLQTVWSTPYIPYDFSGPRHSLMRYLHKYFLEDAPFLLLMAPGRDIPTEEFFQLLLSLDSTEKRINRIVLSGQKLEEVDVFQVERSQRRTLIFGLWPWQFVEYRRVKSIGEFKPFVLPGTNRNFYLADIELELSQPHMMHIVKLRGCAVKTNLNEKARLVILTNREAQQISSLDLAAAYLSRWPNPQETLQDAESKIERFTYTAESGHFFSAPNLGLAKSAQGDIKILLAEYLKALDGYFSWHFLPSAYEDMGFSTDKTRFYDLDVSLKKEGAYTLASFHLPQGYRFQPDLAYAIKRINEREVALSDNSRLWLELA